MRERGTFFESSEVYTVSSLTQELKEFLDAEYDSVRVEGEVSDYKVSHSGHAYFTLKDESAILSCVIWKSTRARMRLDLAEGQLVLATGGLDIYPPRGSYQLVVRTLELAGEGLLLKKFEALKRELEAEGLFAEERKRPIPEIAKRIGVITSPSGAAIRDFLETISGNFPPLEIDLFPVRVQGIGAAEEIAHALQILGERSDTYDLLILMRGGGSLEDLWCFNEEAVARAIVATQVPVISAVGHEVDFTIADFVSDRRAATPTAAAAYVVQSREDLRRRVESERRSLVQAASVRIEAVRRRLDALGRELELLSPRSRIGVERQRIDELLGRLQLHTGASLERRRLQLDPLTTDLRESGPAFVKRQSDLLVALDERLKTLSPQATLRRGYSLTASAESGELLRSVDSVNVGEHLRTRLQRGEVLSQVTEVNDEQG